MAVAQPVVYQDVFEALLKHGVGKRMTPALHARLKSLNADPDQLRPTYPREDWDAIVEAVREALYPRLPRDEALRGWETIWSPARVRR